MLKTIINILRSIFSSIYILTGMIIFAIVLSLILAITTKDYTWFSRGGNLVIVGGLILGFRDYLLDGFKRAIIVLDGGSFIHEEEPPISMSEKEKIYSILASLGFGAMGALISGYGDMVVSVAVTQCK